MEQVSADFDANKPYEYSKNRRGRLIIILIILLLLLLSVVLSVYVVGLRTSFRGSASGIDLSQEVSLANSYVFASPLRARSGGQLVRINVFILDNRGRGIPGRLVSLAQSPALTIQTVQATTDDVGKAVFDVSSLEPGSYVIEASVDSEVIPQRVNITFE